MKDTASFIVLLFLGMMLLSQPLLTAQPFNKLTASNFEHGVVASRPDQMYGWPGITRVKGQEILVSASERKYHVDPWGREVVIRSFDGGKTWGKPQEIYDSELDDRDINLLTMPDGTIIATWFTTAAFCYPNYVREEWKDRVERITQRMREELSGGWLLRSFDGGYTWEKKAHKISCGCWHAGPSVCADGRLVTIILKGIENGVRRPAAFESTDGGFTWNEMGEIPSSIIDGDPPRSPLDENHILEITHGHLLAMFRNEDKNDKYLYQSESLDGGKTWSHAKQIPVWGCPPHLIKLHNGAILCSYGHRREPYGIRAVISYDDGKTWDTDNIITIDEWDHSLDLGYPVTLEVTPGQLITVYYTNRKREIFLKQEHKKVQNELTDGILYSRWQLK